MTWQSRLQAKRGVLVMGCVAAVSLHALLFSYLQIRGSKSSGPEGLRGRDNTPELLQFSSQPVPRVSFDGLPLPKNSLLPPPPALLTPLRSARAAKGGLQPPGISTHGLGKESTSLNSRPLSPRGGLAKQAGQGRRLATAANPNASTGADSQRDWEMAIEQLQGLMRQERTASSFAEFVDATAAKDGQPRVRMALEPPLLQAYQTLWQQAQPLAPQPLGRDSGKKTLVVEVRQASLRQVRAAAVSIRHGEFVVLPDDLQLFWLQGERLFILQSPRSQSASS